MYFFNANWKVIKQALKDGDTMLSDELLDILNRFSKLEEEQLWLFNKRFPFEYYLYLRALPRGATVYSKWRHGPVPLDMPGEKVSDGVTCMTIKFKGFKSEMRIQYYNVADKPEPADE